MFEQTPSTPQQAVRPATRWLSRSLVILFFAVLGALWIYESTASQSAVDKAAYLASQAAYYEESIAQPGMAIVDAIVMFVMICLLFAAYELVAWLVDRILLQPIVNLLRGQN